MSYLPNKVLVDDKRRTSVNETRPLLSLSKAGGRRSNQVLPVHTA
jgi:hypothetical protein